MDEARHVDVLIAGAQKAGTSSFLRYLGAHPSLSAHETPELPFFIDDAQYAAGWESAYARSYTQQAADRALLLAKSAGAMYLPHVPDRLCHHNPSMHIILLLREPGDRAFSAYRYLRARGHESARTFAEAIDLEPARLRSDYLRYHVFAYADRGRYFTQVERLWERFGTENVTILNFDDIVNDPVGSVHLVTSSLGLVAADDAVRKATEMSYNETEYAGRSRLEGRLPASLRRMFPLAIRDNVRTALIRRSAASSGPVAERRGRIAATQRLRESRHRTSRQGGG